MQMNEYMQVARLMLALDAAIGAIEREPIINLLRVDAADHLEIQMQNIVNLINNLRQRDTERMLKNLENQ